jgi:hypothetical protein
MIRSTVPEADVVEKVQVDRRGKEVPVVSSEVKMVGSAAQAARERGKEMGVYEIANEAYKASASHEKKFHETLLRTAMRLEQVIGSYRTALNDCRRGIELELSKMNNGFMPSMMSLSGHAERAEAYKTEITTLTDQVKTLMWGLEWTESAKDEMFQALGEALKGQ